MLARLRDIVRSASSENAHMLGALVAVELDEILFNSKRAFDIEFIASRIVLTAFELEHLFLRVPSGVHIDDLDRARRGLLELLDEMDGLARKRSSQVRQGTACPG